MDLDIHGNTALVSASSSGLGRAAATELAREGANVVINGRDEGQLDEAVSHLESVGEGSVVGQQGDITNESDVSALVERTLDEFGGIDHLVTSAGGPPSGPFMETTDEDWNEAHRLLVMSVVRLVRESADPLREDGGGTIVNITSRSVKEAIDSLVLSNSVRMAVVGLEKTLSREFAPEVRVNAVLPGPHETDRIRSLVEQAVERDEYDSYEEGLAARGSSIPVGHIGDPQGLGKTVAFLSSPAADFITGTTVTIDGGLGQATL
ncbi:SDR family oxidoreductase [Natronorarus salvus]|uniref:SDR family oxidoreductase n=1 Tax=Natronorarus salvus TaxID=3117733 RepID=UPI002F2655E2